VVNALSFRNRAVGALAAVVPGGYLAVILGSAAATRRGLDARASAYYPVALVTMHLSWGWGFLRAVAHDALASRVSRSTGRRSVPFAT
jgi:hypothetical protein